MDAAFLARLREQLQPEPPSLLLLMPAGELRAQLDAPQCDALDPADGLAALPAGAHYAAAVVEIAPAPGAVEWRRLLAALRDRLAARTLVLMNEHSALQPADCVALGFRQVAQNADRRLFRFDLYDYKDRPDWFNPSNWAHPERWDKHRW